MKLVTARIGGYGESVVLIPHSDKPVSRMRPGKTIVLSGTVEIRSADMWQAARSLFSSR